jgi:hypothetical protein
MGVLQRKKNGTAVISVRVPAPINAQLIELRRRAHLLGFNFNATLAGVLSDAAKEIRAELEACEGKLNGASRTKVNGLATNHAGHGERV